MAAAEEEVAATDAAVKVVVRKTRADNNIIIYIFDLISLSFVVSPKFSLEAASDDG